MSYGALDQSGYSFQRYPKFYIHICQDETEASIVNNSL